MNYVVLDVFNNYMDAHIVKGRLESQGIQCWLKDEHLSGLLVDPILTSVIAGIKLLVLEEDVERAAEILKSGNDADVESAE